MAGAMMAIVVPMKFGDRVVPLAWISSGAADETARCRGAGSHLYFWVYKTFPLVGAMSGNEYSLSINSVLGRDISGVRMRRFIRIHDRRTLNLCLPDRRGRVQEWIRESDLDPESGDEAGWCDALPDEFEDLWRRVRTMFYCATERSREFMEWRYAQAPHVEYRWFEVRRHGRLKALAVARFQPTPEGSACRVVDFIGEPQTAANAWRLLAHHASLEGALFTDFMVIGTSQDQGLKAGGFERVEAGNGLEAIPHLLSPIEHRPWSSTFHLGGRLAMDDSSWRNSAAVYFTKGDSDRDWPTAYDLQRRAALI